MEAVFEMTFSESNLEMFCKKLAQFFMQITRTQSPIKEYLSDFLFMETPYVT